MWWYFQSLIFKQNRSLLIDCEFPLRRNPDYLINESASFQVMKTNYSVSKFWQIYLSSYNMPQWVKFSRYIIVVHVRTSDNVENSTCFHLIFTLLIYCLHGISLLRFSIRIDLRLSYNDTYVVHQDIVLHICLLEKHISLSQWRIYGKSTV